MNLAPIRNNLELTRVGLKPRRRLPGETAIAVTWNRLGGLLDRLCTVSGIAPATALAVWKVECGSLAFIRGRPALRFEPHIFYNRWGKDHEQDFDRHFQFGGRNGVDGARWQNHVFRLKAEAEWQRFHGDQSAEYRALKLASALAGTEIAAQCASFGGPQIMGFNHDVIGYPTAEAMRQAFGRSERWQVCAFFDFCTAKDIIGALTARDWLGFARVYNGPGNAEAYAAKIAAAYDEAVRLLEHGA